MDKVKSFNTDSRWWNCSETFTAAHAAWKSVNGYRQVTKSESKPQMDRWVTAGSGALTGFVASLSIFGLSVVAVPGMVILGSVAGYNLDRIKYISGTLYQFSASFRCHIMDQSMKKWREKDAQLKDEITQTIVKQKWPAKQIIDFFWSSPRSQQVQDDRLPDTESQTAACTKIKDYALNMWGTASKTTLKCMLLGISVAPAAALVTSRFMSKTPVYFFSISSALATITYSIPIGITLAIAFPLIQKAYHGLLLADTNYRTTHYMFKDMQRAQRIHQHWAKNIETIGATRSVKT